ncbi:hypothetical protein GCM10023318_50300 [Nocardia callitridis]|uniref:Uncharacterized protein n=1 Tax=Nocardia callitridis TaxID=648753 RepID=A0ABP9KV58_9NOCA
MVEGDIELPDVLAACALVAERSSNLNCASSIAETARGSDRALGRSVGSCGALVAAARRYAAPIQMLAVLHGGTGLPHPRSAQ